MIVISKFCGSNENGWSKIHRSIAIHGIAENVALSVLKCLNECNDNYARQMKIQGIIVILK